MLQDILHKIWIYGGWFYLSLGLATMVCLTNKQLRPWGQKLIWLLSFIIGIYYFRSHIQPLSQYWRDFKLPLDEKINKTTFGQDRFAQQLGSFLPEKGQGCIFWSWDNPTQYLLAKLYPREIRVIYEGETIENCDYVIAQFNPHKISSDFTQINFNNNYLYWRL